MIKKSAELICLLLFSCFGILGGNPVNGEITIIDSRHYSNVFGEVRNFRVFLPPGYYDNPDKRYPVIYFYHGWSQRYFGSGPDDYASYDTGNNNNGDNIAAFVANHEVIVVKPDGYNRGPSEEYYLRPYNVLPVETFRQFPLYFPEIVNYIDASYNTIADRNHRAISGLSMGGFMSFWIGGKYPHLVSAIGSFCGSPEFLAGPRDFPVEYRHIDMFKNYNGINVRLNFGDEDFIRYYHRDLNKIWLQVMDNYQYKVYKGAHSTCGMGEMFEYLTKTFENPPEIPLEWNHIDTYPEFSVWDYNISSDRDVPGFTLLEKVSKRGFLCSVRQHLPDGEILSFVNLTVTTPPLYDKNSQYLINDFDVRNSKPSTYYLTSDVYGRIKIPLDGGIHDIGINSKGDKPNICIASFSVGNMKYARHQKDVEIKVKLLNKGAVKGEGVKASLEPFRKSADVVTGQADFGIIGMNETISSESGFIFRTFSDTSAVERFKLTITDKNHNIWTDYFEVPVYSSGVPEIRDFLIADGREVVVASGGIGSDTLSLGNGNSDGLANPGESIVILVKDGDKLRRTELLVSDSQINAHGENIRVPDNWGSYDHVGGSARYSVPVISSYCPENYVIDAVVEYWMPDYPNHIIKQGIVKIKVTGSDKTPPLIEWMKVTGDNTILVKAIDGSKVSRVGVKLTLKNNPDKFFEADLNNEGLYGDRETDDNVFSYKIPGSKFGIYTAEISAADTFGNKMNRKDTSLFVIH